MGILNLSSQEKISTIAFLKCRYKKGTEVELESINDAYRDLPVGLRGKVSVVDDIGTIHVEWENGATLGVIYGVDSIKIVT